MKKIPNILFFIFLLPIGLISQWQQDFRLTNDPAGSGSPAIDASGNYIFVAWSDNRDSNNEIYFKYSNNNGLNWISDTRLTNNSSYSGLPSLKNNNNYLHLVWVDNRDGNDEIYYKRSVNNGINWETDVRLTNDNFSSQRPNLYLSNQNVYLVWEDNRDGNYEIYFKKSSDNGNSWDSDVRLTNDGASSFYPKICSQGANVYLVWSDGRHGAYEIYFIRSTNNGNTWEPDTRLTNDMTFSNLPAITAYNANIHVVWNDGGTGSELYYLRSQNEGVTWDMPTRLTYDPETSHFPEIAVNNSIVHLLWRDARFGEWEIFYKRSFDNGNSFENDTRLTDDPAWSMYPKISLSGVNVYITWQDHRDGNSEIYYKKNPTGNLTGLSNLSNQVPESYLLFQNYPNPFNPSTKIKFQIKESSKTIIKIYDALGNDISTLVNENLQPGSYETSWNAENYQSGIFFYSLQTEKYSETKKMILIK